MSIKTISKMLIAFSVVLIYMAITMDTTVSTGYGYVHNIGLQSDQTNMLILGGIGFIAGIILFATVKIKQTPEEALQQEMKVQKTKEEIDRVVESTSTGFIKFVKKRSINLDNKKGRALTFLFCSIAFSSFVMFYELAYAMSDFYQETRISIGSLENMSFLGFGLYALRPINASRAMKHLYLFILILATLNILHVLFSYYDKWETYATALISVALFWGAISSFIFWRIERKEKLKLAIKVN